MFLIAGLQPKTRRLDENPRRCPACGRVQAYPTRVDQYLSLFFIPLVRVKRGQPFLVCEGCQQPVAAGQAPLPETPPPSGSDTVCVSCKKRFDDSFTYCPHCGQRNR